MSKYSINDGTLVSIAKAIRAQEKSTNAILVADFASRVSALGLSFTSPEADITGENTMKYIIDEKTITDVADAIRAQEGSTEAIDVEDFAERILALKLEEIDPETVTWADGTYKDITTMLAMHYAGLIDIADYWQVGDIRRIPIAALSKNYVSPYTGYTQQVFENDMPSCELEFRIIGFNHEDLNTYTHSDIIGTRTKAAVTVEATVCLSSKTRLDDAKTGAPWESCDLYTWFNWTWDEKALPKELQKLVKTVKLKEGYSMKGFILDKWELGQQININLNTHHENCYPYYLSHDELWDCSISIKTFNGEPSVYWTRGCGYGTSNAKGFITNTSGYHSGTDYVINFNPICPAFCL